MDTPNHSDHAVNRRLFVKSAAVVAAAPALASMPTFAGDYRLKAGLVGCGGRGTGAAFNILEASSDVEIVALADVFPDRLERARGQLAGEHGERGEVADNRCYVGFDAYERLLADGVDVVILATPPHFRPQHLAGAMKHRTHVFMEKPVATDPAGIRSVLESAEEARRQGLSIVAGTQRRHERVYLEAMARVQDGAIGDVRAASCYWNQGGLWVQPRRPEWSDMEWQLRNWLYFTWLSGDHIVEQHIHNLDVVNWAAGGPPKSAYGMGGRQTRTGIEYGNIFDHFAIEFEYENGIHATSMCRQMEGCDSRVEERIHGSKGTLFISSGRAQITGENPWRFQGDNPNPYVVEHADLIKSIVDGTPLNEAERVARSTLTAIMGRMSCYTGKRLTWDEAMASSLDLRPDRYEFGPIGTPPVAHPGRTPLV